jgi:hypothetical protein
MNILALICFVVALSAAVVAVVLQRRDIVPGYGTTMGGQMLSSSIWSLASLLAAISSLALVRWYFSVLVFIGVFALSFAVRALVERIPKRAP